jgi:hypothetical protein
VPDKPLNRNNVGVRNKNKKPIEQNACVHGPEVGLQGIAADERGQRFQRRFPKAVFLPDIGCDDAHLLRCDLDLQLNHVDCWGGAVSKRLEKIYRKVTYDRRSGQPGYWKNQREWKHYDDTATLIALSAYQGAENFCDCGFYGYSCGNRYLCLRCCHNLLAKPALIEFGSSFCADQECYYIVMSLSGERDEKKRLIFKDLTKSEMQQVKIAGQLEQTQHYGIPFDEPLDAEKVQDYFQVYRQVISDFTGRGRGKLFSGAFGGPELSVRFLPIAALPHANYVAWSPGISNDDVRRLRRAFRNKLRGSRRLKSRLYPKLTVYRIQTKKDYRAVIHYIFKPIDFGIAYELAARSVDCKQADLREMNSQVDYFLQTLPIGMSDVRRMNRYGFCSPASKTYIGHVSIDRKLRRKKDAQRRLKRQKEEAEVKRKFPGYQPHKRRPSKQEKEDALLMRIWYQRLVEDGQIAHRLPKRWFRKKKTVHTRSREPDDSDHDATTLEVA